MNDRTQTVSFRLPTVFANQLTQRGAEQHMSPGEFARRIVLDALGDTSGQQTREELAELREGLERIREDLATAAAALLVNAGKVSADEAQTWVRETLFH